MTPRSPLAIVRAGGGPRPAGRLALLVEMVVTIGILAPVGAFGSAAGTASGPTPNTGPLGLTLGASPTNGSVPLLVAFQASVVPALPSSFQWSFGDGANWTSSGSNHSSITHLYVSYGVFTARVNVTQGANSANATTVIRVSGVPLSVAAFAVPLAGVAPLTVNFSGRPQGGSGTFTALLWSFGDGDQGTGPKVGYTYLRPGIYRAELSVTDSANRSAFANLSINVSLAVVPATTEAPTSSGGSWAYLLVVSVAVVGVLAFVWSRRGPGGAIPPTGFGDEGTLSSEIDPLADPPELDPTTGTSVGPEEASVIASEPEPPEPPATAPEALATRVLLHLYGLGRLDRDGLATSPWTQAGVAQQLAIRQTTASRVLRRLAAGGVVESSTRHVRGQSRRVKVYTLTSSGERLARDLRLVRAAPNSLDHPADPSPPDHRA